MAETVEDLKAQLQAFIDEHGGEAPASAGLEHIAPAPVAKSLREQLDELAAGPFDLDTERRKLAVAAAIAAGGE